MTLRKVRIEFDCVIDDREEHPIRMLDAVRHEREMTIAATEGLSKKWKRRENE